MKIGINLVGVSFSGIWGCCCRDRDWKITKNYIKDNVINCWKPSHQVTVHLTTYANHSHEPSDQQCECSQSEIVSLVQFYNPTRYQIVRCDSSVDAQKITHINSLRMWLDVDVDVIVSTRFDIEFFDKLSGYKIDYDKVNFLFGEGHHWDTKQYVTDNVFFIPKKYLQSFIDSLQTLLSGEEKQFSHLHGVYRPLEQKIGKENIKLLVEETQPPKFSFNGGNPFYYLHRKNGEHEVPRENITRDI